MDLPEVGWGHGLDQSGSGHGQVAGSCKFGDKPSDSTKKRGISRVAEELSASQEGLCSKPFVMNGEFARPRRRYVLPHLALKCLLITTFGFVAQSSGFFLKHIVRVVVYFQLLHKP
jgi:hypothetical protein